MQGNDYSISDIFDNFIEILLEAKEDAIKSDENNAELNTITINKKLSDFITSINYNFYNSSLNLDNNLIKELHYVLASLSDEIFLNLEWSGKEFWKQNLMEIKFFKSHSAGDAIFEQIDTILNRRNFLSMEITIIYLKLLGVGFQGKYRNTNSSNKINDYKKKLYNLITLNSNFNNSDNLICPEGYKFTLTGLPKIFTPNEYSIDHIFYTILIILIIGSSIFWEYEYIQLQESITSLNITNGDKND